MKLKIYKVCYCYALQPYRIILVTATSKKKVRAAIEAMNGDWHTTISQIKILGDA